MESFADVVVEVPAGSITAEVTRLANPKEPSHIRNALNNKLVIAASVLVTGVAVGRQSRAFTSRIGRAARAAFSPSKASTSAPPPPPPPPP